MPTVIASCSCDFGPHANPNAAKYQDSVYGSKRRVFNRMKSGSQGRCSVCEYKRVI